MRIYEVKPKDKTLIKEILQNEIESFGVNGGADMWLLMSFIRYGKLHVLLDCKNNLLSVAQYQAIFNEKKLFLYGFSTIKKFRGKGYGKELLLKSQNLLAEIGVQEIFLTVAPDNTIAIKLYKRLGYNEIEFLKNEYGEGIDRLVMKKELV